MLKTKSNQVRKTENKVSDIQEKIDTAKKDAEEKNITKQEADAVIKQQNENEDKVSANTEKLRRTTSLLANKFNLDDTYGVKKFDDKGKVVNETFENSEFIVTVCVKDSDRHGLSVEL